VAGGAEGLALLTEAVEVLQRSQTPIELLRALVDLGAAERRSGQRVDARRTLVRACVLGERFGAVALLRRAQAEVALMRARGRAQRLTPAEQRVAELAAGGRSTPEIARELYVSPRTVESQLASVYHKLGIGSRRDLAAGLR
jgi:DNA-binding CsgD family transcriptional regulator